MIAIDRIKMRLTSIADAIRERTGGDEKLTLSEMAEEIEYMPAGDDGEAYILVDENGNEIAAVLTKEEVDLTATANDIREGVIAVTDDGVIEGTKEIPSYICREGFKVVTNGSRFVLPIDGYNYTKLQAILCPFNTSSAKSVAAEKVAINGYLYSVRSTEVESDIIADLDNKCIDFGITNTFGKPYLIRFFTFKEEH